MSEDWAKVKAAVEQEWDRTIIPALSAYVEVPNQSPAFDPEWATNGLMEKAFQILIDWAEGQGLRNFTYEYVREKGRTPFLFAQIASTAPTTNTVFMYGHMDKQPPLRPWDEGLDPTKAVLRDNKLYGRGSSDDGYAIFSAISCVAVLQRHNIPHGKIIVVIESGEESGSPDLDYYLDHFRETIGNMDLMICLDSGCLNYEQVWLTTSLRGLAEGTLHVSTLAEGMHSGLAGGVVPDTFRITRELLDRLEDSKTGYVKLAEAHCEIPVYVNKAMEVMRTVPFKEHFATLPGVSLTSDDNKVLALSNFWRPSLTVVGANLPDQRTAGNVIRAETAVKLSLRTPPSVDAGAVLDAMGRVLEADPPYGAKVKFEKESFGNGCSTPEAQPWLHKALEEGSMLAFGKTYALQGMGGGIPFIAKMVKSYPAAQFVVTGVLGPQSNPHGPNEFLHIPYVKGLTFCMARIIAEHFRNTSPMLPLK